LAQVELAEHIPQHLMALMVALHNLAQLQRHQVVVAVVSTVQLALLVQAVEVVVAVTEHLLEALLQQVKEMSEELNFILLQQLVVLVVAEQVNQEDTTLAPLAVMAVMA
jgi:hypothetical protein